MPINIAFSTTFEKSFRKRILREERLLIKFQKKLPVFEKNPFHPSLETHKLTGRLKGLWSFSIDYDCRVVFEFDQNQKKVTLIDIGTHNQVY